MAEHFDRQNPLTVTVDRAQNYGTVTAWTSDTPAGGGIIVSVQNVAHPIEYWEENGRDLIQRHVPGFNNGGTHADIDMNAVRRVMNASSKREALRMASQLVNDHYDDNSDDSDNPELDTLVEKLDAVLESIHMLVEPCRSRARARSR